VSISPLTTDAARQLSTPPNARPHSGLGLAVRFVVAVAGLSIILGLAIAVFVLLLPFRVLRLRAGNIAGRFAGRWFCWVAGITLDVSGDVPDASAPAIFVHNHAVNLDLWLATRLCPAPGSGTVKKELLRVPLIGWAYWLSGHLMLDRGDTARSIRAMDRMTGLLRSHGISLWILPEGTRSRDGRLRPFKKGFAHLALQSGLPIVPVVVHDAHLLWNRGLTVRPGRVMVDVLAPVPTTHWCREDIDRHIAEIEFIFIEHLEPHQHPLASPNDGV